MVQRCCASPQGHRHPPALAGEMVCFRRHGRLGAEWRVWVGQEQRGCEALFMSQHTDYWSALVLSRRESRCAAALLGCSGRRHAAPAAAVVGVFTTPRASFRTIAPSLLTPHSPPASQNLPRNPTNHHHGSQGAPPARLAPAGPALLAWAWVVLQGRSRWRANAGSGRQRRPDGVNS